MNKQEFAPLLMALAEFHEKQLNQTQREMWFDAFQEFSVEDMKAGIKDYIHNEQSSFWPMPAKVKEYVRRQSSGYTSPEEAWDDAYRTCCNAWENRPYGRLEGNTLRAAQAVGWKSITDSRQQAAVRKHFMDIYRSMQTRGFAGYMLEQDKRRERIASAKKSDERVFGADFVQKLEEAKEQQELEAEQNARFLP